jgi:hypothetical protein
MAASVANGAVEIANRLSANSPSLSSGRRAHNLCSSSHLYRGWAMTSETHPTFRGSIPSLFKRDCNVVRLIPRRAAAPFGPARRPLVSFKIRKIWSRSLAATVRDRGIAEPLLFSSPTGTCSTGPWVRITERSMKFSSSRMLPGQDQLDSFFSAAAGMDFMSFSMRWPYFCEK